MDKHNFVERSPKNDTSVLIFTYPCNICPRLQAIEKRLKSIAEALIFVLKMSNERTANAFVMQHSQNRFFK